MTRSLRRHYWRFGKMIEEMALQAITKTVSDNTDVTFCGREFHCC